MVNRQRKSPVGSDLGCLVRHAVFCPDSGVAPLKPCSNFGYAPRIPLSLTLIAVVEHHIDLLHRFRQLAGGGRQAAQLLAL